MTATRATTMEEAEDDDEEAEEQDEKHAEIRLQRAPKLPRVAARSALITVPREQTPAHQAGHPPAEATDGANKLGQPCPSPTPRGSAWEATGLVVATPSVVVGSLP